MTAFISAHRELRGFIAKPISQQSFAYQNIPGQMNAHCNRSPLQVPE